jgi:hypothetical protein
MDPTFIILSPTPPHPSCFRIGFSVKIIILRSAISQQVHNAFFGFNEHAGPGYIIGADQRPHTSFSLGWWVRDQKSGTIFNLSAASAHSLKKQALDPWTILETDNVLVNAPPIGAISDIRSRVRLERIKEIERSVDTDGHEFENNDLERRFQELDLTYSEISLGRVCFAKYGEYLMPANEASESHEKNETDYLLDDWALIRCFHQRIGGNIIPVPSSHQAEFLQHYTRTGTLEEGKKVCLYGSTSGFRSGVIHECHVHQAPNHQKATRNWIVIADDHNEFSLTVDSGASVDLQGSEVRGIIVYVAEAHDETGEIFLNSRIFSPFRSSFGG